MKTSKGPKYLATYCLLAIPLAGNAHAQDRRVEVSPFGGVQFGGSILSRPGRLEIEPDVAYGGATRFDPEVEDVGSEWRFSIGSGLGVKTYLSPRFGLRLEGRVWPTFLQTQGGFLCSLPGGCLAEVEADFLTQGSVTAGFFVTF